MYYDAWHNVLKSTRRRDGLFSYQISFAGLYHDLPKPHPRSHVETQEMVWATL
jgi:hypothetical protein